MHTYNNGQHAVAQMQRTVEEHVTDDSLRYSIGLVKPISGDFLHFAQFTIIIFPTHMHYIHFTTIVTLKAIASV